MTTNRVLERLWPQGCQRSQGGRQEAERDEGGIHWRWCREHRHLKNHASRGLQVGEHGHERLQGHSESQQVRRASGGVQREALHVRALKQRAGHRRSRDCAQGADILVAASKPGPGTVKPEWIKGMADDAIVFATANPIPEIWHGRRSRLARNCPTAGRTSRTKSTTRWDPWYLQRNPGCKGQDDFGYDVCRCRNGDRQNSRGQGINENYIVQRWMSGRYSERGFAAVATAAVKEGIAREKLSYDSSTRRPKSSLGAQGTDQDAHEGPGSSGRDRRPRRSQTHLKKKPFKHVSFRPV